MACNPDNSLEVGDLFKYVGIAPRSTQYYKNVNLCKLFTLFTINRSSISLSREILRYYMKLLCKVGTGIVQKTATTLFLNISKIRESREVFLFNDLALNRMESDVNYGCNVARKLVGNKYPLVGNTLTGKINPTVVNFPM
uniref:Uncharacterized protein n=1 Tax=Cacopsylla melanoneura TaxID=428564 RepID=A0A8D8TE26_9HEMI